MFFSNLFGVDFFSLKKIASGSEWCEDFFLIDKWSLMDEAYTAKMYRIDDFPKTIPVEGRHSELEVFYQEEDKLNPDYLGKENRFLSVVSKLWAYSVAYVESNVCYESGISEDDFSNFSRNEIFQGVKNLFSQDNIVKIDDWEVLRFLSVLSLRNYIATCVYLVDLKIIIWPGDTCIVAYIPDKNQEDFVRTICTTEGLYLYSKGE